MTPSNPPHLQLLINGTKQSSGGGETYQTHNSTGQLISTVDSASWDDIEKAIETANAAQPAWEKNLSQTDVTFCLELLKL